MLPLNNYYQQEVEGLVILSGMSSEHDGQENEDDPSITKIFDQLS